MPRTTRRTFLKAGISAGAAGVAGSVFPVRCEAVTKSVSGSFSVPGLQGTVSLSLAAEAPDDSSFAITVDTVADGTYLARIKVRAVPAYSLVSRASREITG